jgi:hypothetical protein
MIKWGISQAKRTETNKVVLMTEWFCEAKDGRFHEVVYGQVELDEKDLTAPDFIPFEQITQQQMLDWVFEKIDKAGIEAKLTAIIDEQKAPALVSELPWQVVTE